MNCVLYIDPCTGDDVTCNEDLFKAEAKKWKHAATLLAILVQEDNGNAERFAQTILEKAK